MPVRRSGRTIPARAKPSARIITRPKSRTNPSIDGRPASPAVTPMGREAQPTGIPAHSKTPTRPGVVARAETPGRGPRIVMPPVPAAITPSRSVVNHAVIRERPAVAWQIADVHNIRSRIVNVNVLRVVNRTAGWNVVDSNRAHVRHRPRSGGRRRHIPDSLLAGVIPSIGSNAPERACSPHTRAKYWYRQKIAERRHTARRSSRPCARPRPSAESRCPGPRLSRDPCQERMRDRWPWGIFRNVRECPGQPLGSDEAPRATNRRSREPAARDHNDSGAAWRPP
jgi:hypothetical protein